MTECTCKVNDFTQGVDSSGGALPAVVKKCPRCLKRDAVFEPGGLWPEMVADLELIRLYGFRPNDKGEQAKIEALLARAKEVA